MTTRQNVETTVALGRLVASKANVRRVASEAGREGLVASIAAHGLIQNLVVRKAAKGGKYEVVAGGRRLGALRQLMKDGGSVQGVAVDKDYPVRVVVQDDAADGTEISLAENVQREPMHPVDEVVAYRELVEHGLAAEDIAARFGQSVATVRQRLKLAALSPRILDELRSGEMTLEQARALAISDDHVAQERVWFEREGWSRNAANLRAALTDAHVRATDRLARYVGLDAYEAAGGVIARDLFNEDETYLVDASLLTRLGSEKLQVVADELAEHGWKWVEVALEGGYAHQGGFGRIYPRRRDLTEDEDAALARLSDTFDQLEETLESLAEGDGRIADIERQQQDIEQQVTAIQRGAEQFDKDEQALAGCFVGISYGGELQVIEGVVRGEDRKALQALRDGGKVEATEEDGGGEAVQPKRMSDTLVEELTAIKTAALRVEMSRNPSLALAALLYPLVVRLFYGHRCYRSGAAVEVTGQQRMLAPAIKEPDACQALAAWQAVTEAWAERLPVEPDDLWAWLCGQEQTVLLELLAVVAAANLNAVRAKHDADPARLAQAEQVAGALALDMGTWWTPGDVFLSRLSKADIAEAIRDAGCDTDAIHAVERSSKADAVKLAAEALGGTGWLPDILRSAVAGVPDDKVAEAA